MASLILENLWGYLNWSQTFFEDGIGERDGIKICVSVCLKFCWREGSFTQVLTREEFWKR